MCGYKSSNLNVKVEKMRHFLVNGCLCQCHMLSQRKSHGCPKPFDMIAMLHISSCCAGQAVLTKEWPLFRQR